MIERCEDSTRRLHAEYDEHISEGLKMEILLEMVPSNISESLMARLPDKNAKDENDKDIAKYPITKEILVQYIEAKTDFGGPMPVDCGHPDFHDAGDGDGSNESSNGEVHAIAKGLGRTGSGFGGKGGVGAPFCGSVQRMWRVRTQIRPLSAKNGRAGRAAK